MQTRHTELHRQVVVAPPSPRNEKLVDDLLHLEQSDVYPYSVQKILDQVAVNIYTGDILITMQSLKVTIHIKITV